MLKDLAKDIRIVAYARFNKSKRIKRKSRWSLLSISFLSLVLILLTISEKNFSINMINPIFGIDFLIQGWFFSVFSSISILVISIAIASSKYDAEIEKLNDSALRLNALFRSIEADEIDSKVNIYSYYNDLYRSIILENSINHEELDYRYAKAVVNGEIVSLVDRVLNGFWFLIPYYFSVYVALSVFFSIISQVVVSYD